MNSCCKSKAHLISLYITPPITKTKTRGPLRLLSTCGVAWVDGDIVEEGLKSTPWEEVDRVGAFRVAHDGFFRCGRAGGGAAVDAALTLLVLSPAAQVEGLIPDPRVVALLFKTEEEGGSLIQGNQFKSRRFWSWSLRM